MSVSWAVQSSAYNEKQIFVISFSRFFHHEPKNHVAFWICWVAWNELQLLSIVFYSGKIDSTCCCMHAVTLTGQSTCFFLFRQERNICALSLWLWVDAIVDVQLMHWIFIVVVCLCVSKTCLFPVAMRTGTKIQCSNDESSLLHSYLCLCVSCWPRVPVTANGNA